MGWLQVWYEKDCWYRWCREVSRVLQLLQCLTAPVSWFKGVQCTTLQGLGFALLQVNSVIVDSVTPSMLEVWSLSAGCSKVNNCHWQCTLWTLCVHARQTNSVMT